jgi:phosphatidylserine decarboxylase
MTIHKEGRGLILATTTIVVVLNVIIASVPSFFSPTVYSILSTSMLIVSIVVLVLVLQFFRLPSIEVIKNEKQVLAPADGKSSGDLKKQKNPSTLNQGANRFQFLCRL